MDDLNKLAPAFVKIRGMNESGSDSDSDLDVYDYPVRNRPGIQSQVSSRTRTVKTSSASGALSGLLETTDASRSSEKKSDIFSNPAASRSAAPKPDRAAVKSKAITGNDSRTTAVPTVTHTARRAPAHAPDRIRASTQAFTHIFRGIPALNNRSRQTNEPVEVTHHDFARPNGLMQNALLADVLPSQTRSARPGLTENEMHQIYLKAVFNTGEVYHSQYDGKPLGIKKIRDPERPDKVRYYRENESLALQVEVLNLAFDKKAAARDLLGRL